MRNLCKSDIGQQRIFVAGIQEVVGLEKLSATPVFNFFHTAIEIIREKNQGKHLLSTRCHKKGLKPALGSS